VLLGVDVVVDLVVVVVDLVVVVVVLFGTVVVVDSGTVVLVVSLGAVVLVVPSAAGVVVVLAAEGVVVELAGDDVVVVTELPGDPLKPPAGVPGIPSFDCDVESLDARGATDTVRFATTAAAVFAGGWYVTCAVPITTAPATLAVIAAVRTAVRPT